MKRAQFGFEIIRWGIVILVVIIIISSPYLLRLIRDSVGIFPGGGSSNNLPDGVLIIRADTTNQFGLEFKNVNGWVSLDSYPDVVTLEHFSFSKKELQNNFKSFYLDAERESQNWLTLPESYRTLDTLKLHTDGTLTASDHLDSSLGSDSHEITLTAKGILSNKGDEARYASLVPSLVAWRDEMLENGVCQKLLGLTVNGARGTYEVRRPAKTDTYLVIDVSRKVDKPKGVCVKGSVQNASRVQLIPLKIYFSIKDGDYLLSWNNASGIWEWSVEGITNGDQRIIGDFQNKLIVNNNFNAHYFYNGLEAISGKFSESYYGVFGIGSKKVVLSRIVVVDRMGNNRALDLRDLVAQKILNANHELVSSELFSKEVMLSYYDYAVDSFDYFNSVKEQTKSRIRDFSLYRQGLENDTVVIYYNGSATGLSIQKQSSFNGLKYYILFTAPDGKSQKILGEVKDGLFSRSALLADPPEAPLTEEGFAHILALDGKRLDAIPSL